MVRFLSIVVSFCSLFLLFAANAQAGPEIRFAVKGIYADLARHPEYAENSKMVWGTSMVGGGFELSPGWRFNRYVGLYGDISFAYTEEFRFGLYPPGTVPEDATWMEMSFFLTPRAFIRARSIDFYAGFGIGVRYAHHIEDYKFDTKPDRWKSLLLLKAEIGLEYVISDRVAVGVALEYVRDGFTKVNYDKSIACASQTTEKACFEKAWTKWSKFGSLTSAYSVKVVFSYKL